MSSKKTKILICIDVFLPSFKSGGPIRSIQNLVLACGNVFDFDIVTQDRDSDGTAFNLPTNTWLERKQYRLQYLTPERRRTEALQTLIQAGNYDWVYVNSFFSPVFNQPLYYIYLRVGTDLPRLLIAPRGQFQAGAIAHHKPRKIVFIGLLRLFGIPTHERIYWQATDEQENIDLVTYLGKHIKIRHAQNLPAQPEYDWEPTPKAANTASFMFLSRISPKKNLPFILDLLEQHGQTLRGTLHFHIYGTKEVQAHWDDCQKIIDSIERKHTHIKVVYERELPNEEVQTTLRGYHFFLLPTKGENFGHAIMEGLLAGRPVVISDKTPWRKLTEQRIGFDLPLSDTNAWLSTLQTCIDMSEQTYNEWSKATADFAKTYANNPKHLDLNLQLFAD